MKRKRDKGPEKRERKRRRGEKNNLSERLDLCVVNVFLFFFCRRLRRRYNRRSRGKKKKKTEEKEEGFFFVVCLSSFSFFSTQHLDAHSRMLRHALAAASKRGAVSAVEAVLPSAASPSSSSAAAAAFVRSFAALPATTDASSSSPFLRFASPAPAAHDFTPALKGLPETKVRKLNGKRRRKLVICLCFVWRSPPFHRCFYHHRFFSFLRPSRSLCFFAICLFSFFSIFFFSSLLAMLAFIFLFFECTRERTRLVLAPGREKKEAFETFLFEKGGRE